LSWPYRRRLLFDELEEAQGDIVCLQEVQADHYETDINPFMVQLGYDGVFKQKSREGMGSYGKVIVFEPFYYRFLEINAFCK
jgi:CCR4-NOT transcription complex subunit 6